MTNPERKAAAMAMMGGLLQLLVGLAAAADAAAPQPAATASRQSLAAAPPRGWLSWGRFRCFTDCSVSPDDCISERLVLRTAKAMVAQGFATAGFRTVNIDSCWASRDRDPHTGLIVGNTSRFPRGMKALADDLHAMNLSFGLYTNMGPVMGLHNGPGLNCSSVSFAENGCSQARRDIETMASWGIDMLKIDGDSGADSIFMNQSYPLVDSFLRRATSRVAGARPIVYSCSWPAYTTNNRNRYPIQYNLMRKHCNTWRNYRDIQPTWISLKGTIEYWGSLQGKTNRSVDGAGPISAFIGAAGRGAWNDPDQLLLGNTPCPKTNFSHNPRWMKCSSFSRDEERSQLAVWSIVAAPLLMSVDIETMPAASKADLLNPEILAVNSDALGRQGHRVSNDDEGRQVWLRQLQNGDVAVALHNSAEAAQTVRMTTDNLGFSAVGRWVARDLFERTNAEFIGAGGVLEFLVPAHGVMLLRLSPSVDGMGASALKTDDSDSPCHNAKSGAPATGGATNMVLAYMDDRSFPNKSTYNPEMVWNTSMFHTLLTGGDSKTGQMFDGVLTIGISWFGSKQFYPGGANWTTQQDWKDFLNLQLTMGALNIDKAAAAAGHHPAIILTIPFPDTRAQNWGVVNGRPLNMSERADQIAAATWFVDFAREGIHALKMTHAVHKGFYWFNEDIQKEDYSLVQAVARHIHALRKPEMMFIWIPYFQAAGWSDWRSLGFDVATMQLNWAFHSHPGLNNSAELFAKVANDTSCAGMGVEMELPLSVRNPQIPKLSWRSSFDTYSAASRKYEWQKTLRTYYYGNSFVSMAATDPEYFAKLRTIVRMKSDDDDARPKKQKTLAQYDQVGAQMKNGTLNISLLTQWLKETHANTISFLLWDDDGHQYLDLVRFLDATNGSVQVWVTLIPPHETMKWVNQSGCTKCPASKPYQYGSPDAGVFCCGNKTGLPSHCVSHDQCCVVPGKTLGCQSNSRCGVNPENHTVCGEGDPKLPPNTMLCSVPADSPLTSFNESALVDHSMGFRGCSDYVGWARILNELAHQYPALEAVNIDDFAGNKDGGVEDCFANETYSKEIFAALHAAPGPGPKLIPTIYYGSTGHFVFKKTKWLPSVIDGALFYFGMAKAGSEFCSKGCASGFERQSCAFPCMYSACTKASVKGLAMEIQDFVSALPSTYPIHIGLYFSTSHSIRSKCGDAPTFGGAQYSKALLSAALAIPTVSGATVYTLQHPNSNCPNGSDGGCVVQEIFGEYARSTLKTDEQPNEYAHNITTQRSNSTKHVNARAVQKTRKRLKGP